MNKNLRCLCDAQAPLLPAELAPGLPARHCAACGGSLLDMSDYRLWCERAAMTPTAVGEPVNIEQDATGARKCPGCTRLMERLRLGAELDFRIDRCIACQAVWFDRGEWFALVKAGLAGRLTTLLSDGWQRQLQSDELRARREAILRARHGDACIDEVIRIRAWLDTQASRDELLSILRAGW